MEDDLKKLLNAVNYDILPAVIVEAVIKRCVALGGNAADATLIFEQIAAMGLVFVSAACGGKPTLIDTYLGEIRNSYERSIGKMKGVLKAEFGEDFLDVLDRGTGAMHSTSQRERETSMHSTAPGFSGAGGPGFSGAGETSEAAGGDMHSTTVGFGDGSLGKPRTTEAVMPLGIDAEPGFINKMEAFLKGLANDLELHGESSVDLPERVQAVDSSGAPAAAGPAAGPGAVDLDGFVKKLWEKS